MAGAAGSQEARRKLVEEHASMARAVAIAIKKQIAPSVDLDDMVGYGMQGLVEAAERFDLRHGVTFVTYAYHRVRGAVFDGLRQMGHLPRGEYARLQVAQRAQEALANLGDREIGGAVERGPAPPTPEEDLRALYAALATVVTSFVTSLDALGEKGVEVADEGLGPEDRAQLVQALARVRDAVARLPERERYFIEAHYYQGRSLLEAGEALGLSKSWASRLHARALERLRQQLES